MKKNVSIENRHCPEQQEKQVKYKYRLVKWVDNKNYKPEKKRERSVGRNGPIDGRKTRTQERARRRHRVPASTVGASPHRAMQVRNGLSWPPHSRRPSSFISFPSGHMARYAANVWSLGGKLLARSSTSESQLPGTNYSFSRSRTEYTHTTSSDAQTVTNRKLAQCVPRLANFWHPLPYRSEAPILDTSRVH